jgi:hypothetical protein
MVRRVSRKNSRSKRVRTKGSKSLSKRVRSKSLRKLRRRRSSRMRGGMEGLEEEEPTGFGNNMEEEAGYTISLPIQKPSTLCKEGELAQDSDGRYLICEKISKETITSRKQRFPANHLLVASDRMEWRVFDNERLKKKKKRTGFRLSMLLLSLHINPVKQLFYFHLMLHQKMDYLFLHKVILHYLT